MTIHVVYEDDSRLRPAVSRSDDALPDVWRVDHPGFGRLLAFVGVIAALFTVAILRQRIEDRALPRHAFELGLEPFVVFDGPQEFISDGDRDIEIGQRLL